MITYFSEHFVHNKPNSVNFKFISHKKNKGFISFAIVENGHPWLKGFENAFCSDGLKFNGNSFSKSLKDIVKYIQKYNLKYNTKYNKILIYFQFSEEEENKKYLKNFLQVIKDNKEYFIYEFKRNN